MKKIGMALAFLLALGALGASEPVPQAKARAIDIDDGESTRCDYVVECSGSDSTYGAWSWEGQTANSYDAAVMQVRCQDQGGSWELSFSGWCLF